MRPKSAEFRPEKGRSDLAVPSGWEDSLAADRRRPNARWSEVSTRSSRTVKRRGHDGTGEAMMGRFKDRSVVSTPEYVHVAPLSFVGIVLVGAGCGRSCKKLP